MKILLTATILLLICLWAYQLWMKRKQRRELTETKTEVLEIIHNAKEAYRRGEISLAQYRSICRIPIHDLAIVESEMQ